MFKIKGRNCRVEYGCWILDIGYWILPARLNSFRRVYWIPDNLDV